MDKSIRTVAFLATMAVLTGCGNDVQEPVNPEPEQPTIVTHRIKLTGDILQYYTEPLSRITISEDDKSFITGIQVSRKAKETDDYEPYAMLLDAYGNLDMEIDLVTNFLYKFEVNIVNQLDIAHYGFTGRNDDYWVGSFSPNDKSQIDVQSYTPEKYVVYTSKNSFGNLACGIGTIEDNPSALKSLTLHTPPVDRFYGVLNDFTPSNDLEISLKRSAFELYVEAEGLVGTSKLSVEIVPKTLSPEQLALASNLKFDLVADNASTTEVKENVYNRMVSMWDLASAYSEVDYTETYTLKATLDEGGDKETELKSVDIPFVANKKTVIKYKMKSSGSIELTFNYTESPALDKEYEYENGVLTEVTQP